MNQYYSKVQMYIYKKRLRLEIGIEYTKPIVNNQKDKKSE